MCGCGNAAQSGPTGQVVPWVATPNDKTAKPVEFTDKTMADQYVAAFGGGTVKQRQLEEVA